MNIPALPPPQARRYLEELAQMVTPAAMVFHSRFHEDYLFVSDVCRLLAATEEQRRIALELATGIPSYQREPNVTWGHDDKL